MNCCCPFRCNGPRTTRDTLSNRSLYGAHETWCLDDWFPAQPHACWVIREAEDSQPLQESFLLMPASERSDRPVFTIAVFAETEPKQLIAELADLYQVAANGTLISAETLQRLQRLYERGARLSALEVIAVKCFDVARRQPGSAAAAAPALTNVTAKADREHFPADLLSGDVCRGGIGPVIRERRRSSCPT